MVRRHKKSFLGVILAVFIGFNLPIFAAPTVGQALTNVAQQVPLTSTFQSLCKNHPWQMGLTGLLLAHHADKLNNDYNITGKIETSIQKTYKYTKDILRDSPLYFLETPYEWTANILKSGYKWAQKNPTLFKLGIALPISMILSGATVNGLANSNYLGKNLSEEAKAAFKTSLFFQLVNATSSLITTKTLGDTSKPYYDQVKDSQDFTSMFLVNLETLKDKWVGPYPDDFDMTSILSDTRPKIVGLNGEPGLGKTLLMDTVAKKLYENGKISQYYRFNGAEVIQPYVNQGADKLNNFFKDILAAAGDRENPSKGKKIMISLDECELLKHSRKNVHDGVGTNNAGITSTYMKNIDLCKDHPNIFIMESSNFNAQDLDSAASNRVNKIINIGLPNREQCYAIIQKNIDDALPKEDLRPNKKTLNYLAYRIVGLEPRYIGYLATNIVSAHQNEPVQHIDIENSLSKQLINQEIIGRLKHKIQDLEAPMSQAMISMKDAVTKGYDAHLIRSLQERIDDYRATIHRFNQVIANIQQEENPLNHRLAEEKRKLNENVSKQIDYINNLKAIQKDYAAPEVSILGSIAQKVKDLQENEEQLNSETNGKYFKEMFESLKKPSGTLKQQIKSLTVIIEKTKKVMSMLQEQNIASSAKIKSLSLEIVEEKENENKSTTSLGEYLKILSELCKSLQNSWTFDSLGKVNSLEPLERILKNTEDLRNWNYVTRQDIDQKLTSILRDANILIKHKEYVLNGYNRYIDNPRNITSEIIQNLKKEFTTLEQDKIQRLIDGKNPELTKELQAIINEKTIQTQANYLGIQSGYDAQDIAKLIKADKSGTLDKRVIENLATQSNFSLMPSLSVVKPLSALAMIWAPNLKKYAQTALQWCGNNKQALLGTAAAAALGLYFHNKTKDRDMAWAEKFLQANHDERRASKQSFVQRTTKATMGLIKKQDPTFKQSTFLTFLAKLKDLNAPDDMLKNVEKRSMTEKEDNFWVLSKIKNDKREKEQLSQYDVKHKLFYKIPEAKKPIVFLLQHQFAKNRKLEENDLEKIASKVKYSGNTWTVNVGQANPIVLNKDTTWKNEYNDKLLQ